MTDNVVQLKKSKRIDVMPVVDGSQIEIERAVKLLEPSINRTKNTSTEDVLIEIMKQQCLLWTVKIEDTLVAAFTTCVLKHPQRKTLLIEHMGGIDMKQWMHHALHILKEVAVKGNLDAIEAEGRIGFAKLAQPNGFKETHRHYELEI